MDKVTHVFLAGGGTGGHIYPNLAAAEAIRMHRPEAQILYFCSSREIDAKILSKAQMDFIPLPAQGFSASPRRCIQFFAQFIKSYYFVRQVMAPLRHEACVLATGGFVSAPVVMAAKSLKIPVVLVNVDSVPGKANRFLAKYARKIFVQFELTRPYFAKYGQRVAVSGCPLRREFDRPDAESLRRELKLADHKKILLVTGASSGAQNINRALLTILPRFDRFADQWQIVHLTGTANFDEINSQRPQTAVTYTPVDYCDRMADLLAAADLVVGRSGAVSVAEYMRAGKPVICMPYPYHRDRHQYLNADELVRAGAAVIVDDQPTDPQQTAASLLEKLTAILADPQRYESMRQSMKRFRQSSAADEVAKEVLRR